MKKFTKFHKLKFRKNLKKCGNKVFCLLWQEEILDKTDKVILSSELRIYFIFNFIKKAMVEEV